MSGPPPPRRWTALLALVPARDRGHLTEELEVLFRVRVESTGLSTANSWYRREVVSILVALWGDAARRTWRRMRREGGAVLQGTLGRDFARALRSYRHNPGFALLAIATLTVGIGAATVIFSVFDQVVLRPLPYPEPGRLVAIWPDGGVLRGEIGVLQSDATTFEVVAGYAELDGLNLERADGSRRISGLAVSPELLLALRLEPALGRGFALEESQPGNDLVAMLSWGVWNDDFGGAEDVVGQAIRLEGQVRTVVGVLPPGLDFPGEYDAWIPLTMDPDAAGVFWGWGGHRAIGRLGPGQTAAAAQAEALRLYQRMRVLNTVFTAPVDGRNESRIVPLRDAMVSNVGGTLWVLLGAVGLVLVAACANVANLLLARGLSRGRELAVRVALGAGRGRIVSELLVEALMLAAIGCGVALLTARWALQLLVSYLPPEVPRGANITLDGRVAAAGVALALLAGCASGLAPAIRGARVDPGAVLRSGGRGVQGASRGRRRVTGGIVIAQIAIAVVLVIGAGLLVRSLNQLASVRTGFDATGVTTARLTVSLGVPDAEIVEFYRGVVSRLSELPGVDSAAIVSTAPFGPGSRQIATAVEDVTDDPRALPVMWHQMVTADYIETLRIPLLQGRGVRDTDTADSALVAVVNDVMAKQVWPDESPIGRRIAYPWRGSPWIEVVGVVGSVADRNLAEDPVAGFLIPVSQMPATLPARQVSVLLRTDMPPQAAGAAIRDAVGELDPLVPVSAIAPLERIVWGSAATPQWTAIILAMFAGAALVLGCVGVYGVMSYSVRERTREIGVRMALGAEVGGVRRLVLRDGLRLALPGAVLGLLLALPLSRVLSGMLFEVSSVDATTYLSVPVALVAAAVVACYVPARRATRVDPVTALRRDG